MQDYPKLLPSEAKARQTEKRAHAHAQALGAPPPAVSKAIPTLRARTAGPHLSMARRAKGAPKNKQQHTHTQHARQLE